MSVQNDNPWLGLASYEEKDAKRFFGRSQEIKSLSEKIFNNLITVIYGLSGVGKTSILKAGIFPLAREKRYLPIYIRLQHNDSVNYEKQIINRIEEEAKEQDIDIEILNENPLISSEHLLWTYFRTHSFWNKKNYPIIPLLVFDQFEEIFTLTNNQKQITSFFNVIDELTDNNIFPERIKNSLEASDAYVPIDLSSNFNIVFSLREDFLARLEDNVVDMPLFRKNRFGLQSLTGEQVFDVILGPGKNLVTREVATCIVKKVVGENASITNYPNRLTVETSILSLFCSELFKKMAQNKMECITNKLVEDAADNIILNYYEESVKNIPQKTIEYLENNLLTKSGFRNTLALEDVLENNVLKEDINNLEKIRLIKIESRNGTERIEYTHDILCKVAKQRRDNRDANIKRKSSIWTIISFFTNIAFAIPSLFILLFPLSLAFYLLHNNDGHVIIKNTIVFFVVKYSVVSLVYYFIFQTITLKFADTVKEKKLLSGSIIILIINCTILGFVFFSATQYKYNNHPLYMFYNKPVILIYLLIHVYFAIITPSWFIFKSIVRYKDLSNVYCWKDIFLFKHITQNTTFINAIYYLILFLIFSITYYVGLKSNNLITLLFITPIGILSFLYLCHIMGYDIKFKETKKTFYLLIFIFLLVLWSSQFIIRFKLIIIICSFVGLLITTYLYIFKYSQKSITLNHKIISGFLIWFISFFCLPITSIGYNIFKYTDTARAGNFINSTYGRGIILIKKSKGHYGVRDRYNLILPLKFNKIIPQRMPIEFSVQEDSILYAWDVSKHIEIENEYSKNNLYYLKNRLSRLEDLNLEYFDIDDYDIRSLISTNLELATLYKHSNIDSTLSKICNAYFTTFNAKVMGKEFKKYYLDFQKKSINDRLTYLSDSINLNNPLYYNNLSYYSLFSNSCNKKAEDFARKAIELDSINKDSYINLSLALLLQNKQTELEEILLLMREEFNASSRRFFKQDFLIKLRELEKANIIPKSIQNKVDRIKDSMAIKESIYSDNYVYYFEGNHIRLKSKINGEFLTPKLDFIFDKNIKDSVAVFIQNGKRGYLNINTGKILIPAQFDRAWIFSEGLAAVVKKDELGTNKLGFINFNGEIVIPLKYFIDDRIIKSGFEFLFRNGFCLVCINKEYKFGFINTKGEWLYNLVLDGSHDYYYMVSKDNKYGLLDIKYQLFLPVENDTIIYNKNQIIIKKDGKTTCMPIR